MTSKRRPTTSKASALQLLLQLNKANPQTVSHLRSPPSKAAPTSSLHPKSTTAPDAAALSQASSVPFRTWTVTTRLAGPQRMTKMMKRTGSRGAELGSLM